MINDPRDGGLRMIDLISRKNRAVTRIRHIEVKSVLWLKILKT